jgi:hypothetical protein
MNSAAHDITLRRYLLGQLPEQAQREVEERLFIDNTYLKQVELAEDDLVEAYVSGDLSSAEREQFETHFLHTPERRRHLQLTRTLREVSSEEASSRPPIRAIAPWLAMAASLVIVISLAAYVSLRREKHWAEQLAVRNGRITDLENQLKREREQPELAENRPMTSLPSYVLKPEIITRDPEDNRKTPSISRTTTGVQLFLNLEMSSDVPYNSYRVVVETSAGKQVWSGDKLEAVRAPAGHVLVLVLPGTVLQPAEYRIIVSGRTAMGGLEELDEYVFRVVAR